MKRRNMIFGLGATVAGGAAALGSGAFTSVGAERTITIETANDGDAYLELFPAGSGRRALIEDNVVKFEFPSFREQEDQDINPNNPDGLGVDSVYRFRTDVEDEEDGILRITNSGTQSVDVFSEQKVTDDVPHVKIFDVDTGNLLTPANPYVDLSVGEDLLVGFQIDTSDVTVGEYDVTLTLVADADPEPSN